MKPFLLFWLSVSTLVAAATGEYRVKVFNDANRNGVFDDGEAVMPGVVVSNYSNIAVTGKDGSAVLPVEPKYNILWVHEPSGYRTGTRYRLSKGGDIEFGLYPIPVKSSVTFIQLADTETKNLPRHLPIFKDLADKLNVDFIFVSGDLTRFPAIAMHSEELNEKTMGREVMYTIGNHDIVADREDGTNYQDYLGPYWYSFERNGLLFIALPMTYGDVKLPYNIRDFGDWLNRLLSILPADKKIVLLGHNLPGQQMPPKIVSNSGEVDLKGRLAGVFFGHWHLNLVLRDPDGSASAYCVANPNKAGIDHDPATIRFAEIADDGKINSKLIWTDYQGKSVPAKLVKSLPKTTDESLQLYNSTGHNGYFPKITADRLSLAWIQRQPFSFGYSTPVLLDNFLYIGVSDEANGIGGGVLKINGCNGEIAGKFTTGYSVRNTLASDGKKNVFGNDVRGNIFSVNAETMKESFIIPPVGARLPPIMNGVVFAGNTLYAGLFADLKAVSDSGKVLWQNAHTRRGGHGFNGVLTLTDELVISASTWGGIFANRRDNGELVWKRNERNAEVNMRFTSATVVYADGKLWVKSGNCVYVLNPNDGKEEKRYTVKNADLQSCSPVVVLPDRILVATTHRGMIALDKSTGNELWRFSDLKTPLADANPYSWRRKTIEAPMAVTQNSVWFGANDGYLYQLDIKNGSVKSAVDLGTHILSAPLILSDRLYIATAGGNLYAFELK